MVNLLNWLFAYSQRLQLVQAQSDQAYSQMIHEQTLTSLLKKQGRKLLQFVMKILEKLKKLDDRNIERLIWIGIIVVGILLYYFLKKDKKQPPENKETKEKSQNKKQDKNLPKRNNSLMSMKQYQSHSDSGKSEKQNSQIKLKKNEVAKKITKQFKQFYTDIETQPYNAKYEQIQTKQDQFFFTLVGSYKKTSQKQNENIKTSKTQIQQDFKCSYQAQQEDSPLHKPKDNNQKQIQKLVIK